jgi:anaerobic selenocysteine-containing dehydrogenase
MPSGPTVLFTCAAVPPRGEARCELDIARPLLERLAQRQATAADLIPWRSQREFNQYLLGNSGISLDDLARTGYHQVNYTLGNFDNEPFPTPTRKVELYSTVMEENGLDPLPAYRAPDFEHANPVVQSDFPLLLVTGDREKSYHHSRFRDQPWAIKVSPDPRLSINPKTASRAGISEGAWVLVEIADGRGQCRLRAKITDAVPLDVVNTGMGWWLPAAPAPERGALDVNINAALSYDGPYDPASGSADIRGLRCRVRLL